MRALRFSSEAWDQYLFWLAQDPRVLRKLNELLRVTQRTPYEGIGKPEALKGNLAGCWSRRIDQKNRLVYQAGEDHITIIACRGHY